MSTPNGGPAFPVSLPGWGDNGADGMSLRDYIAIHALTAIMYRDGIAAAKYAEEMDPIDAKRAYRIADAMLKVRGGTL